MIKAGILGATGYAGVELARLLLRHPAAELAAVGSVSFEGQALDTVYPALRGVCSLSCEGADAVVEKSDVVFAALPHGLSQDTAAACAAGIPTEIRPVLPVSAGALGPGRRGRGFLHGQIDPSCLVDADHLHFDRLSFAEHVADIGHVGMGDLRDVDQTGPPAGQGDERTEFGDAFDGSFQDCAYTDFHKW